MQFEKQIITIDKQIECIDRAIDMSKSMLRVFDADGEAEIRADVQNELITLIAVRQSLRRLEAGGATRTAISVPASGDFRDWESRPMVG